VDLLGKLSLHLSVDHKVVGSNLGPALMAPLGYLWPQVATKLQKNNSKIFSKEQSCDLLGASTKKIGEGKVAGYVGARGHTCESIQWVGAERVWWDATPLKKGTGLSVATLLTDGLFARNTLPTWVRYIRMNERQIAHKDLGIILFLSRNLSIHIFSRAQVSILS